MASRICDVRSLQQRDIPLIVSAFKDIGWDKPASLYQAYLKEQVAHLRSIWVAFKEGVFAGYVTLKWHSEYAPFHEKNIPEISDLNVLPHFRKQGIASALLDLAEAEAHQKSATVGIGVGLSTDYGDAQNCMLNEDISPMERALRIITNPSLMAIMLI